MTTDYSHEPISMFHQSRAPCCPDSKGWQNHPTKPYTHALESQDQQTPSEEKPSLHIQKGL